MTDTLAYDPFAAEVIADPYPFYARLVDEGAIHHLRDRDLWVLCRYDDVVAGARDATSLSSAEGVAYQRFPLPMMITVDPPDHTRLRRLVARDFTPRAIETWRPVVERIVTAMVADVADAGEADVVTRLAGPLPVLVIAEILGIPPADHADFKRWSDDIVEGFKMADAADELIGEHAARVMSGLRELHDYLHALFVERRTAPRDDLLTKLMQPREENGLTGEELFWFCLLLLVAGNETTTNLLGNMILALARHTDQWQLLHQCPHLVPAAVEEALRFDPPVQGFFRTARGAYRVGDDEIPEGARVLLLFAAANRDPRRFEHPERFLVERNPSDHLAFGSGIHSCLGAGLARMEGGIVLRELLARVKDVELVGEPVRGTNPTLRGPAQLPVRLVPA